MTSTTTITLRTPVSLGRPTGRDGGREADLCTSRPAPSSRARAQPEPGVSPAGESSARGRRTTRHGTGADAGGPPPDSGAGPAGRAGVRQRWGTVVAYGSDAGMATAEYAIAMIAAVGFASLLVTVLSSGTVRGLLTGLVTSALSIG